MLPYHGQAATDPHEWVRGQAKSGATHFHAYATAYVVLHGQRFTVATTYVRQGEKAEKVLQRLLRRRAQGGVRPSLLLLDRGFWNEARVVTCSRSPSVRLFLVGVALVLRNVWVGLHHAVSSTPRRGRRRYRLERLRFKDLLLMLLHAAERALSVCDELFTERPIPIEVGTTGRPRAG